MTRMKSESVLGPRKTGPPAPPPPLPPPPLPPPPMTTGLPVKTEPVLRPAPPMEPPSLSTWIASTRSLGLDPRTFVDWTPEQPAPAPTQPAPAWTPEHPAPAPTQPAPAPSQPEPDTRGRGGKRSGWNTVHAHLKNHPWSQWPAHHFCQDYPDSKGAPELNDADTRRSVIQKYKEMTNQRGW